MDTNPTIHLNGTSGKDLEESYGNAADKLEDFCEAWGQIEFNARDYYVQGPEAYTAARKERDEAAAKIREVRAYLQRIRESISDQMIERERRAR